ncbi:PREDICTED: gamma-butyrobetaine dioxygenase-like [Branchiostoma belcheri]|uniref:Gamma-butyrobetaine dioxygenase-like n=1 Tax=Branchiostoma belcheri TaxID=7741 RepID=A0A6P4Y875_BRABE|nr:PREDICTED: gamma-butyrobetaine dioxygenase-like [Branchiostoma belcheri]
MALVLALGAARSRLLASWRASKLLGSVLRLTDANTERCVAAAASSLRPSLGYQSRSLVVGMSRVLQIAPKGARSMSQDQHQASPGKGMERATLVGSEEVVEVEWSVGGVSKYPYVWLRDNCQCSKCFAKEHNNRLIMTSDIELDAAPVTAEMSDRGSTLLVTWPDGHQSQYDWQWLRDRCFSPQARADRETRGRNKKQLWGADISADLTVHDFPALLSDDRALYNFLYGLDKVGLVLVQNVPRQVGQVEKLANRVSFLKQNVYGTEIIVKSKPDDVRTSEADSTRHLEIHNDEPYYSYAPGVQILHYIEQTEGEGGTSLLVDSFNAAYQLKEEDPEAFWLLTTFKVHFIQKKAKHKSHIRNVCHVISLDDQGEVQRVNYMMIARDSVMDVPLEQVKPFHRALKAFNALLYHPNNCLHLKMKAGEMYAVDNGRTLHGRTAFNAADGVRHLRGGYLDWDGVYSRMRVLREDLGIME